MIDTKRESAERAKFDVNMDAIVNEADRLKHYAKGIESLTQRIVEGVNSGFVDDGLMKLLRMDIGRLVNDAPEFERDLRDAPHKDPRFTAFDPDSIPF